ncbi:hypothetical protein QFZ72_001738 [Bacillus sp. V2I10]|jgi:hypothetical protein|nr:hypothetical protein [Bacillus sp. V2I10]
MTHDKRGKAVAESFSHDDLMKKTLLRFPSERYWLYLIGGGRDRR